MHVVVNAQLISDQRSYRSAGMSNYSRNLVRALGALAPEHNLKLTALTNSADIRSNGLHTRGTRLPLHRPAARIAWEQLVLPRLLRRLSADLVHGLVNVLPLASTVSGAVTVHDLSFLHLPQLLPAGRRLYLKALCRASVQKAAVVIAVSRQTADDVVHYFDAAPQKVIIIYNGVDDRFSPVSAESADLFRRRKNLPDRYFLFVGTLEPRKNLPTLLAAYARWRKDTAAATEDIKLIVAGGKGWYYDTIFAQVDALELRDHVMFPGYVPDEELPDWYRAAFAFVYPSVFEGFGLPVLEAMACGTPVLCSNIGALSEVSGGGAQSAALLVPPNDVAAWTAGLNLVADQPALRQALGRRGLSRAQSFSWRSAASRTIDAYSRALAE